MTSLRGPALGRGLVLATAILFVLPLAWRGVSCGQDFDFHLQNWLELTRGWQAGVFYPRWTPSANYGAGEPRFVFYPPLSRYLGALLGAILPWSWTLPAFTLVALLGAAWAFSAMAAEWTGQANATLAASLYIANPYLLFVVYERGALAELLSAIWMPLLVLYGLRSKPAVVPLALTVAAIWLTNAPAAVMGCYLLAVLVAGTSLHERSLRLAGRAASGVALGLGLTGFWLAPAILEQRWVDIEKSIGPLMRVEDSFLFEKARWPAPVTSDDLFAVAYHNQVLHTASWIAVALMAVVAFAAWFSRRPHSRLWKPLVLAAVGIGVLQFRWSDPVWRLLPEMRFLQFPWRWLLVLGMIAAALIALALQAREPSDRRSRVLCLAAVLLFAGGMAALAAHRFWQPCDEDDNVQAQIATFRDGGFAGTDEYTPKGADNEEIQQELPPLRVLKTADADEAEDGDNPQWAPEPGATLPAQVVVQSWTPNHIAAAVTTAGSGYAVLRLMDYPAWHVTRNGAEVSGRVRRADGLLAVPVQAGTNRIDVRWRTTADQGTGILLSLGALAVTLALIWKGRRRLHGASFR